MFPLHERTRRWICRTLFLLLGVLPTATVLAWCVHVNSAGQRGALQAQLQSALGLKVELGQIAFPRLGCTLLHDVKLLDPETSEVIATTRLVEIDDNHDGFTILSVSQPEVFLTRVQSLVSTMERRLHSTPAAAQRDIRLVANELTLRYPGGDQTLIDCSIFLETAENSRRASLAFRLPGSPATDSSRQVVQFERRQMASDAAADLTCDFAVNDLPFSLCCAISGQSNHLGTRAMLSAKGQGRQTSDGWQGEVSGQLHDVDLHSLVSEQFPQQISGMADVTLHHAVIVGGRWEEATGVVHAGPGNASAALLAAAAECLGLQRGSAGTPPGALPPAEFQYDELAANFTLDAKGLALHGCCGGPSSGVLLRNTQQTLLADGNHGLNPVLALVKMLVPDSRLQVPATRQTDWLLQLLPVPDVIPADPQAAPQARLHGSKNLR
jgi:hypothetical protein